MNRRRFLKTVPVALAASAQDHRTAVPRRVCLVGGESRRPLDITAIFDELGIGCDLLTPAEAENAHAELYSILWIACAEYPYHKQLSDRMLLKIGEVLAAGGGVFAEYTINFPGAPARPEPWKTGIARLFVSSPLGDRPESLPEDSILDEHDSICLPFTSGGASLRSVLSFGEVKGVERVLAKPAPGRTWPGLVWGERGAGRFAVAATSISGYRKREYAPLAHWQRFLRDLVLALLPAADRRAVLTTWVPLSVYTEPRGWVQPGSEFKLVAESREGAAVQLKGAAARHRAAASGRIEIPLASAGPGVLSIAGSCTLSSAVRPFHIQVRVADRDAAYRRALARNIRWFERSGALLRPDGSAGVAEWISGPDIEGRRIPYGKGQMFSPERTDCVFESGLAFCLYGKAARSDRSLGIGRNLLLSILDFQRLGRNDSGYGLWYTRGRSGPPYQDDIAWATIGCLAGHRYSGMPILLHRGLISAEASLRAFRNDGKNGLAPAGEDGDLSPHPHDRGQLLASWLYAFGATGDRTYLDAALPLLRDMIERFPAIPRFLISRTEEACRFLLPLALAYAYTGDAQFLNELRRQSGYIASRIAPCGAIQEDGSNAGSKLSGNDLGLTYNSGETVSDQLYTTSFAAMNLWIAYKATSEQPLLEACRKVMDYLVRIQIEDESRPAIDGGWARGFDYSLWEYYGSNADEAWTCYCLETGWANAIIDMALALYLSDDGFYPSRARVDWKG